MYPTYCILPWSEDNYPVSIKYQITNGIVSLLGQVVKPLSVTVVSCPRPIAEGGTPI